ncbi:hypothetical protein [Methylomonas sp. YC3]
MRPFKTSKASLSLPPTSGPIALFNVATSSAQSSPSILNVMPLDKFDGVGWWLSGFSPGQQQVFSDGSQVLIV